MEILKYLNQFLIQSNWLDENVPEQDGWVNCIRRKIL